MQLLAHVRVLLFVVFGAFVLAACGGGGGGDSGPSVDGSLSVSPNSLSFQAESNGATPVSQFLSISSSNPATYQIIAGYPVGTPVPGWLGVQFSGSGGSSLRVSITSTGLSSGTYNTTLRIVSARIDDTVIDYKDIPITFTVSAPQTMSASPASLSFNEDEGVAPATQVVSLSMNSGSVPSWNYSVNYTGASGWLTITPDVPNNSFNVIVAPLGAGTYQASIVISYSTPGGSKQLSIPVSYTANPLISISASSLQFTEYEGAQPTGQNISIVTGGSNPPWVADVQYISGANWLQLTPTTNNLNIQPIAMLPGSFSANIIVSYSYDGINTSTVSIPVTYVVSKAVITSPASLAFTAVEGEDPAAQTVNVTYLGGSGAIAWSASIDYLGGVTGWLAVNQSSGSSLPVNLGINPGPRLPGTYQANVIVNYTIGTINNSITIPVTYTVNPGVSPSTASIVFAAVEGEDPAAQTVNVGYSGSAPVSTWTASIDYLGGDTGWLAVNPGSGSSLPVNLSINPGPRTQGTYQANVIVNYTINTISNSITIPVTYTVNPGVSLSTSVLNFSTLEGKAPASQNIAINYPGTGSISWSSGSTPGWLTLTPTSGGSLPASITVQPGILPLGFANTQVTLSYVIDGISTDLNFNVNYDVLTAWATASPASVTFALNSKSTAADLTQEVMVGDVYTDASTIAWTASADVAWLTVTTSGDTDSNNTVSISLVESELANLQGNETATVTLLPTNPNISPLSIPVSLNFNLPTVYNVTPNVRFTNKPTPVILRGTGFNALTDEVISFGDEDAASYTVISDTEIHVTPPATAYATPGTYHVRINKAAVLDWSTSDLHIVDAPVFDATSFTLHDVSPYIPDILLFDPLRNAIFYVTDLGTTLYKLQHVSGTTWTETSLNLGTRLRSIAMSPDSKTLLISSVRYDSPTTLSGILYRVDPDSLTQLSVETLSSYTSFDYQAPMNNNKHFFVNNGVLEYPALIYRNEYSFQGAYTKYSESRDIALIGVINQSWFYRYDASTDSFQYIYPSNNFGYRSGSISHFAERTVSGNYVYDANFNVLGYLDTTLLYPPLAVSPAGDRAYVLSGTDILTFDISGNTGPFLQIGSPVSYTADTAFEPEFVVMSQDGGTLFIYSHSIYGPSTMYVVPTP